MKPNPLLPFRKRGEFCFSPVIEMHSVGCEVTISGINEKKKNCCPVKLWRDLMIIAFMVHKN
jgi:hypothetical protein